MRLLSQLAVALLAGAPLFTLMLWGYEPAALVHYPNTAELILGVSPQSLSQAHGPVQERVIAVLLSAIVALLLLLPLTRSVAAAVFCGSLTAALTLNPLLVSALLDAEPHRMMLGVIYAFSVASVAALLVLLRKLPATLWALAAFALFFGAVLSVRTGVLVVLHANPPLHTLNAIARTPESVQANLAMANHMVFLNGENIALRYYLRAIDGLDLSGGAISAELRATLECLASPQRNVVAASCRVP